MRYILIAIVFLSCSQQQQPQYVKDSKVAQTTDNSPNLSIGEEGNYGELSQYFWKERSDTIPVKLIYFDSTSQKSVDEDAYILERYLPIKKSKDARVAIVQDLVDKNYNKVDVVTKPGRKFLGAERIGAKQ